MFTERFHGIVHHLTTVALDVQNRIEYESIANSNPAQHCLYL